MKKGATSPIYPSNAESFPVHVLGDYAIDELVPTTATVPLNTKDPALWTLRDVNDDYVKQVPGGAWFQYRMMQSISVAWEQWRTALNLHLLQKHVESDHKDACPPIILRETDFNFLCKVQPTTDSSAETLLTPDPKGKRWQGDPEIISTVRHSNDHTEGFSKHSADAINHVYHWSLERKPKNNPVDDKDQVFRAISITPQRKKEIHNLTDLGLDREQAERARKAKLLIIGDYDLDFRYLNCWKKGAADNEWQKAISQESTTGLPRRIILLGGTLPGEGRRKFYTGGNKEANKPPEAFWDFIDQQMIYKDTVLVAGMDMLRLAGADIAYDQSWDRILEDFNREMQESEILQKLLKYEHLVIRIGVTGAIYNHNPNAGQENPNPRQPHKTLLIYNPDAPKVWFRAPDAQGNILGLRSAYATCIAARLREGWKDLRMWKPKFDLSKEDCQNEMKSQTQQLLIRGIKDAICFTQDLYREGYGEDASKVEQRVDVLHFAEVYSRTVLNGGHASFAELCKKNDQASRNVTIRRLPQRVLCIAHVHAPLDESSMEWGIMRNMLRIGIPEHLEESRALQMARKDRSSELGGVLDKTSRLLVEKQISAYSEQRRLGIAMRIVELGEASIMNRNDKHHEYQRVLECMPIELSLPYSGDSAEAGKWRMNARELNKKRIEAKMNGIHSNDEALAQSFKRTGGSLSEHATFMFELNKLLQSWTHKDLQGAENMEDKVSVAGLTLNENRTEPEGPTPPLYFFKLNECVDEWDLPHYVAMELWAQTSKLKKLEKEDEKKEEAPKVRRLVRLFGNYLRLLLWTYPCQAPVARFGEFTAIDQCNVEAFANIRNLLINHVRSGSKKPLNVAVFGGPGSGKSFGVKQIAQELGRERIDVLEFNMTHFLGKGDLDSAFLRVSSSLAQGKTPLVFFDEFDCPGPQPEGDFQWLSLFLEPMQDGTYQHAGGALNLRNSIFVFAGGRHASFQEFQARVLEARDPNDVKETKQRKFPDFLSRIRGYVNVPSLNSQRIGDEYSPDERETPYIQRALMVRSVLERNGWCEVDAKGKKKTALIDFDVAEALLTATRYHHGKRSIENLLNMAVRISNKVTKASFPTTHQLNMHTWGGEFRERMQLPGCAWLTPYMFVPTKDVSASAGQMPPTWHEVKDWELLNECHQMTVTQQELMKLWGTFVCKVLSDESRVRVRSGNMLEAEKHHLQRLLQAFGMTKENSAGKERSKKSASNRYLPAQERDETGPWRKPWEVYGSYDEKKQEEWEKCLPEWEERKKISTAWTEIAMPVVNFPPHIPSNGVIPLVMLQPVHTVCLRLYYRIGPDGMLLQLTSDSTLLSTDLSSEYKLGEGYSPKALWTESWSWYKHDKSRVLLHILKNLHLAVHGPKHWQRYKEGLPTPPLSSD